MSIYTVSVPKPVPTPRNVSPVSQLDFIAADDSLTYLATWRREPIAWLGIPLTSTTAGSGDKYNTKIRIPPFCIRIQWGVCAIGSGQIYVHASASPASETYATCIDIDKAHDELQPNESWAWTALDWDTTAISDDDDPRPLLCTSSVEGDWETQELDIWIVDSGGSKPDCEVYAMEFRPVQRVTADGALA